jgi:hypothetical protein
MSPSRSASWRPEANGATWGNTTATPPIMAVGK